jgi:hypothetical protein
MKNKWLLTALVFAGFSLAVQASTVTWSFLENGPGTLGATSTFTESGIALTAYASSGETLYAKNDGSGETGLGITSDVNHEINSGNFVQLNLTTTPLSSLSLVFLQSVQSGESATIWYSTIQGILGAQIGTLIADGSFAIPSADTTGYIGISAGSGNVLLNSVSGTANTPDGGTTMMLLGSALMGLGLIKRKLSA